MGIPVQKWQWPVNQTHPLGATCAACVKLHKGKTVLTFHHERVWERILSGRVTSFAFYVLTRDSSRVTSQGRIIPQNLEQSISHPPSFLSSSPLFSESCVPQREEFQLSAHWLSVWSGIWQCGLSSLLWRGRDWFCQSGDCLTSSLNHKTIDWEWWIHS